MARHGRTADNAEGRILGRGDPPLDAVGERQAHELAASLFSRPPAAIWASPLRRARATAAIVAEKTALEPVVLADLIESKRGAWEGRLLADIRAADPSGYAAFLRGEDDFAFPGGESVAEQRKRAWSAISRIAEGAMPALAVAHAGTIRSLLSTAGVYLAEADLPHGRIALAVACPEDG
ncbi:MAG TPA: histidine phosphatase family protein [Solirubrobacterales bacterium]|nr:histidine phosphatase family protein [Solirubrobacterales bacterium]